MRDQKKAEEVAVQRFQLISPLLAEGLDAGKASKLKRQICQVSGFSERTIRRYLFQFRRKTGTRHAPRNLVSRNVSQRNEE